MTIEAPALQRILPHRYPFLFLDRVLEIVQGERIVARKCVSVSDPLLQGHFPGNPILPGVVQVEAMAQAAVVLAQQSGYFDPETQDCLFIGIQEAKFRAPVVPGDVLDIEVKALRLGRVGKFEGQIRSGDAVCSSAKFTAIIEPKRRADDHAET
ncbi:MAG: 3-hydroxyacyl-ACP dehydratase FabZ [Nannocystaceae bacterium]|nr:3-hydroxyacyl-ACP dehydratase FabZ [Myxococcales bacterium]